MMKKDNDVWTRNEDGSVTFKLMKTASTTLIQDDKVAVQVTFQHKPSADPAFKPEEVQFVMPLSAARELADYFQRLAAMADDTDPANATLH